MISLPFFLLIIAGSAALCHRPRVWAVALLASLLAALTTGLVAWTAIPILTALAVMVFAAGRPPLSVCTDRLSMIWQFALWTGITILAFALAVHLISGIHSITYAQQVSLAPGSSAFDLQFHYDKAFVGASLLLLVPTAREHWSVNTLYRYVGFYLLPGVLITLGLAWLVGIVQWQPKWSDFFWPWMMGNLFITCIAEEAFFRLLLQQGIERAVSRWRFRVALGVGISAILFALVHLPGGAFYAVIAGAAGLFYALIFAQFRRIELSILAHFSVNATHFLLFTYPVTH